LLFLPCRTTCSSGTSATPPLWARLCWAVREPCPAGPQPIHAQQPG
jgi:hypothetical protein